MKHSVAILRISLLLCGLTFVGAGAWFGRNVPFSEQWPMFEALRTTASIIFAVIGAWLAIIYPDRLKLSFKTGSGNNSSTATGIGQLFTPVVHSTAILCVILVLGVIVPLAKHIDIPCYTIPVVFIRGGSYALLVILTLWQLWTVLLTLIPADRVKDFVDAEDQQIATIAGHRGDKKK